MKKLANQPGGSNKKGKMGSKKLEPSKINKVKEEILRKEKELQTLKRLLDQREIEISWLH